MITRPLPLSSAVPGGSATYAIYDNGPKDSSGNAGPVPANAPDKAAHGGMRVRVMVYTNVSDAVFRVRWAARGSSNLRTFSTTTIAASTAKDFDVLVQPGRTVIDITTVTAPTTFEVDAELVMDQAKAS